MACFYKINEMALGATGSSSIAAVPSRFGEESARRDLRNGESEWGSTLKRDRSEEARIAHARDQIAKAKRLKAAQKPRLRDFVKRLISRKGISENIDIAGITSQLKGLENKNNFDNRNTVTYGVEDDEGNLMKVTVKAEDAKSFENRLALELGEVENNKIYGYQNSGVSLAEVLYNLKDEFNIVDVEFPEIPSDIIYNADKASLGEQTPIPTNGTTDNNQFDDQFDDQNGQLPPPDGNLASGSPNGLEGEEGGFDEEGGLGDESLDQGQDFIEDEGQDDFKTMFNQLLQLMTAQAEKEKAIADAEAEKARALQAEYSAKAANHEISRQEEVARMQAELDAQKKKEKDAKQMADIAKYRVNQNKGASGMNFESTNSFLKGIIEDAQLDGDLETENMVRREMQMARQKYQVLPNDDDATKQYKAKAWQAVNNQLQARLRQIRAKSVYTQQEKQAAAQAAQKQAQQNQQQQQAQVGSQPTNPNGISQ